MHCQLLQKQAKCWGSLTFLIAAPSISRLCCTQIGGRKEPGHSLIRVTTTWMIGQQRTGDCGVWNDLKVRQQFSHTLWGPGYPSGMFSETFSLNPSKPEGSWSATFVRRFHTGNQGQMSFCPSTLQEISVFPAPTLELVVRYMRVCQSKLSLLNPF